MQSNEVLLKRKYRCIKTKGKHHANENAAPRKHRREHGPQNYVYGDVMGIMDAKGKITIMRVISLSERKAAWEKVKHLKK